MAPVVVIGSACSSLASLRVYELTLSSAGVIGLSTALRLQDAGHAVTILARDLPQPFEAFAAAGTPEAAASINFSSPWAGAHNRWVPPPPLAPGAPAEVAEQTAQVARDHGFALETFAHLEALAEANPECGVRFMRGIEYVDAPGKEYAALDAARAAELGMRGFKLLDRETLPEGVSWGCEYDTWCANPMVYCMFMLRRFVLRGGTVVKKELRAVEEAWALLESERETLGVKGARIVVNCSGNGFADGNMFVTRGPSLRLSVSPLPFVIKISEYHKD
jgi:D-amino-acid oxidase